MSNPRTAIVTRIVKTDVIPNVLEAYEKARPVGLGNSLVQPQATASTSAAPGVLHDAGKVITGAVVGATAGFKAGLAVAGVQAANDTWNAITDWWNQPGQEDDLLLLDFDYLKPFPKELKENIYCPDFLRLRQLYDLVFMYQSQKMKSGWLRTGLFSNYTEGKINDAKYLAAILIGRKLIAALKAPSPEECALHMGHLNGFIQRLSAVPAIYATRSDDSTYLSLITMVEKIREDEFNRQLEKLRMDALAQIKASMKNVRKACRGIMTDLQEDVLYALTKATPELHENYRNTKVIDTQRPQIEKIPHFAELEKIFLQEDIQCEVSAKELALLLSDACGVKIEERHAVIVSAKALLEKRKEILRLNDILARIEKITKQAGDLGFSRLLDEMRFVMKELQQHYFEMMSLRNEFFSEFIKLKNTPHQFKVKRLQYTCQELNDGPMRSDMINLLALTENMSAADISKQVEDVVQTNIDGVKKTVKELKGQDNNASLPPFEETMIQIQQTENRIEVERIKRLEAQVLNLTDELGKQLVVTEEQQVLIQEYTKQIETFKSKTVSVEVQKKMQVLGEEIAVAKARIIHLEAENAYLKLQIAAKEQNEADKTIKDAKDKEQLKALGNTFVFFIDKYINQERGCFNFWHRHGDTGQEMAKTVLRTWKQERENMIEDFFDNPPKDIFVEGAKRLLETLTQLIASDKITGNFHKHSLKTYMLGYYNYLKNICDNIGHARVEDADVAFRFYQAGLPKDYHASGTKARWVAIAQEYNNPAASVVAVPHDESDSSDEAFIGIAPRQ